MEEAKGNCRYSCTSQMKQISIISSKIPLMAPIAESHIQSHSNFRLNPVQCMAQETVYNQFILRIKVSSTRYSVRDSITRDMQMGLLINWSSMKMVHYPQKLSASYKTAERHQGCIWWGQTPRQTWKNPSGGRQQMEFWTISTEYPKEGTVHSHATMTVDSTSQAHPGRQWEQQDQNFNWELLWTKWNFSVLETD